MKVIIFLLLTALFTSCHELEYGGELKLTDSYLEYFPDGDELIYRSDDGEILHLYHDTTIFIEDKRINYEEGYKYYIVDEYTKSYVNKANTAKLIFNLQPLVPDPIYLFRVVAYMNSSTTSDSRGFSFLLEYNNFNEFKDDSTHTYFDSVEFNNTLFEDVIIMFDGYSNCEPPQETCVDSVYYNQEYGVVRMLLSNGNAYTIDTGE